MERLKSIGIVVLCIIIALLLFKSCDDHSSWEKEREGFIFNDSVNKIEISRTKDALEREIVRYEVREGKYSEILASKDSSITAVKNSLRELGLKIKNVKSITTVATVTRDTIKIPVDKEIDLNTGSVFDYNDKWLTLAGKINFKSTDGKIWADNVDLAYTLDNKVNIAYVYDRKWFLAPKRLNLTVMSENPNTTVNKVQTFVIKEEKKFYEKWWFQMGVGLGAGIYIGNQIK